MGCYFRNFDHDSDKKTEAIMYFSQVFWEKSNWEYFKFDLKRYNSEQFRRIFEWSGMDMNWKKANLKDI